MDIMAMNTIYINNLNEKPSFKKTKRELQAILDKYGEVVSLIIKTRVSLKGQAFVTFKSPDSSKKAQRELDGFKFLGNTINVKFAKENSIAHYKNTLSEEEFQKYVQTRSKKRKAEEEEEEETRKKRAKVIRSDVPHNILLLQNLPSSITNEELVSFFSKFKGFTNVRLIKVRKLSFIEFTDIATAKEVMSKFSNGNIQEFMSDEKEPAFITYAKQ